MTARWQRDGSEMTARKRHCEPSVPDGPKLADAFYMQTNHTPFDTARVLAIGARMQRLRLPVFTVSYGCESTEMITWSRRENRFFEVFYSD